MSIPPQINGRGLPPPIESSNAELLRWKRFGARAIFEARAKTLARRGLGDPMTLLAVELRGNPVPTDWRRPT